MQKGDGWKPGGSERVKSVAKKLVTGVFSLISGAVNALFGGGGGMLAVPALRYGVDVEEKRAHATSIAVMLPLTVGSVITYSLRGAADARVGIGVCCGSVVGGAIGALLLKKVPKSMLSMLFYGVMIYAGIAFLK